MSRRRVLRCSCARAAGARGRSRRRPSLRPAPAALGLNRHGRTLADPLQELLRVSGQSAQLPGLPRFGGGHQRRATAAGAPASPCPAPASPRRRRRSFGSASRRSACPAGVPTTIHESLRRRCTPSPTETSRRGAATTRSLPSSALDPAPCALDLCVRWEEEEGFEPPALSRYGFQDRRLRPLGHSSGLTFLVEPEPSYPDCPVREAHEQAPGSLLTMAASGTSPSTTRNAGWRKPTAAAVGSGSCTACPSTATVSPSRSTTSR